MTEFAPYQKLEFAFRQLLAELSKTWSAKNIAYLRDILAHAESGEALENLVTLGVAGGTTFGPGLMRLLDGIGSAMRVDAAAMLKTAEACHRSSAANAAA